MNAINSTFTCRSELSDASVHRRSAIGLSNVKEMRTDYFSTRKTPSFRSNTCSVFLACYQVQHHPIRMVISTTLEEGFFLLDITGAVIPSGSKCLHTIDIIECFAGDLCSCTEAEAFDTNLFSFLNGLCSTQLIVHLKSFGQSKNC